VCFLIAIGAARDDWRLASWLEDQLGDRTDVAMAPLAFAMRFPAQDLVLTITSRGCSCDMLTRVERATRQTATSTRVALSRDCRQTLAGLTRRLGALRLFVGRFPGTRPSELSRLSMTADQLAAPQTEVPTELLVEVAARSSSHS
jgi:hypothetical protein